MNSKASRFRRLFSTLAQTQGDLTTTGEETQEFDRFLKGQRRWRRQQEPPPGTARAIYGVALQPWHKQPGEQYSATFTPYSKDILQSKGSFSAFGGAGHQPIVKGETKHVRGYYPALLRVFVASGEVQAKESSITDVPYRYRKGWTASLPFGRVPGGDEREQEQRETLTLSLKQATSVKAVTYIPEYWAKSIKPGLIKRPIP